MTDLPFSLSLVDNEVSDQPDESLAFTVDHGMRAIELMSLWGMAFEAADQELRARARDALEHAGIEPTMILSPAFKTLRIGQARPAPVESTPGWCEHMDLLQAAMDTAVAIGCPRVRLFTCRLDSGGENPSLRLPDGGELPADRLDVIRSILIDAARRAADLGLILCVENVRSCFGNSGRNTAAILAAVDHPAVRVIWDPANDFVAGGHDFRPGYEATKPWIAHVHAKDATVLDAAAGLTEWTAIGHGDLDWPGQLRALLDDGYADHVSLETHWHPVGCSRAQNSHDSFQGLLQAAQSASAMSTKSASKATAR